MKNATAAARNNHGAAPADAEPPARGEFANEPEHGRRKGIGGCCRLPRTRRRASPKSARRNWRRGSATQRRCRLSDCDDQHAIGGICRWRRYGGADLLRPSGRSARRIHRRRPYAGRLCRTGRRRRNCDGGRHCASCCNGDGRPRDPRTADQTFGADPLPALSRLERAPTASRRHDRRADLRAQHATRLDSPIASNTRGAARAGRRACLSGGLWRATCVDQHRLESRGARGFLIQRRLSRRGRSAEHTRNHVERRVRLRTACIHLNCVACVDHGIVLHEQRICP